MRWLSILAAAFVLFGTAALGWLNDVPSHVIALRASAAAAVMFIVATLAGRGLVAIVAQAVRSSQAKSRQSKDNV